MVTQVDILFSFGGSTTRVLIGTGLLSDGSAFSEIGVRSRAFVLSDSNVWERCGPAVGKSLIDAGWRVESMVIPPGELSKTLERVAEVYEKLARFSLGRDGLIVAVGGGVVTDLAGFIAATWMRGVTSAYVPTTLEADIDACIGGKTGVNWNATKNLIGVFHHPRLVVVDARCLSTVSDRDLSAGMAESIKHALLAGEDDFAWHEANADAVLARDDETLVRLIDRNLRIKAGFVARDPFEQLGHRDALNLGHTIGHGIEAACGFNLRHGECVALGLVAACWISERMGLLPGETVERVVALLARFRLPIRLPSTVDESEIMNHLRRDKKFRDGNMRFVLLESPGRHVVRSDVAETMVRDAIASLQPG
ncbi:MAG: 3-dehydroquinate synthase [Phycisphaerales bacterium]|nr:3-dehydroquinate synthase [Phycisphaerales bacterium]